MKKNKKKSCQSKKLRKGDKVIVIAGNYKGQSGEILKNMGDRVTIQGVNLKKKHVKPSEHNPKGDILSIEHPIHISNVQFTVDGEKRVKVKMKCQENGVRTLVYNEGSKEKVYREIKKST